MTTRIVNKYKERFDVYIGRGSKWGNEFVIEKDNKGKEIPGSRERVINQYREYIMNRPDLLRLIPVELKDKTLGCFCKPKPCHGDVLVELADARLYPHL
jgi:Domain of unknown function (DUF4326)